MRPGHHKGMSNFAVGLMVIIIAGVGTWLGFRKELPFRNHYTLKAAFSTSNNIRLNSPVRIAGVNIGKVTKIEHLDGGGSASVVTMRIDKKGLPIHKDAKVRIRPRIFLEGNFFVDIQPGSPSAASLDDGDTIPLQQTSAPVQIDQILTSLQKDTRTNLQALLGELSSGLKGRGAEGYSRSQKYWTPAYRDGAIVADASRGVLEHDLSGYVASAGATAEALDRNSEQLKSLITDFNTTAGAFASRDRQLAAAIDELPRTLAAGMPALAALNRAFPPLRGLIRDLRPGVRSSTPTLKANLPLIKEIRALLSVPELRGLVSDLKPAVPPLTRLNKVSVPLLKESRLASSCQNEVILPWSKDKLEDKTFPATGPVYQDSLKVLPGLAGESRTGDANGQWFRVLLAGGLYATPNGAGGFMFTDQPVLGANPPPGPRSPLKPDVPCETQEKPDLRTVPGAVPTAHKAVVPASRRGQQQKLIDAAIKDAKKLVKRSGKAGRGLKVSEEPATLKDLGIVRALRNSLSKKGSGQ